jgi:photosystem II stability/assembly factor-like uncharacterized protein
MKNLFSVILLFIAIPCVSQKSPENLSNVYSWRNVGPANQGGRVVDIEAIENDFQKVYVATGSGGVWYSDNAGTTWTPIFDNYSTASIGDIAIYQQDPSIIWIGTGEANNRNSVSWGDGIFKSIDGGKSFQNMGLNSTHQIARVITIPDKPDEVCVCAIGHLWGESGDRGLFKTADGGKTWSKLTNGLPADNKTGCNDLVIDPANPQIMYVSFYQRLRRPWTFHSGGPNGGIFKTTDGGKSWKKLTNGLPADSTGRIGLAIYQQNPKIVMALVEAKRTDTLAIPGSGVYRSEDGGESWKYVNTYNNRPFYYSQIRINPLNDLRVYLLTTRFMVSDDGGKNLRNGSADEEVHGDFHALWLDPTHADRYYLGADKGFSMTHDHGKKFILFDNLPIAQYYRISFDYRDPYYVYGGLQDNGFYATASFSRDIRGILNDSNWKVHWGDGMFTEVDPDDWRRVITSSENGGINKYDPVTHRIESLRPTPLNVTNASQFLNAEQMTNRNPFRFNWSAPIQMDHKSKILYLAGNHILKSTNWGESWEIISPDLTTNDPEKTKVGASGGLTPDNSGAETHCTVVTLAISPLDENILWAGTDDGLVHITRDGGKSWTSLRKNFKGVPEGIWVSRIEASQFKKERAYLSFDGHRSDHNKPYLFVTENGGKNWTSITANLPQTEVIRVVRENPVNENLLVIGTETGIWATIDRGKNWFRFMPGMPTVSVYDLAFHPRDHDLIAGTHGRSLWIMDNMHALEQLTAEVQQKEFYLFDQPVATLWENTSRGGQRGHFWYGGENPEEIRPTSSLPRARYEVDALLYYYLGDIDTSAKAEIIISNVKGQKITRPVKVVRGINKFKWDREFDSEPYTEEQQKTLDAIFEVLIQTNPGMANNNIYQRYLNAQNYRQKRANVQFINRIFNLGIDDSYGIPTGEAGTYEVVLKVDGKEERKILTIREDPILKEN